jgi:hypothetical protein
VLWGWSNVWLDRYYEKLNVVSNNGPFAYDIDLS